MTEEYKKVYDKNWSDSTAKTFDAKYEKPDIVLNGLCPKCQHEMEHRETISIVSGISMMFETGNVKGAFSERRNNEDTGEAEFTVSCNCNEIHPNSNGERGCGAYWVMRASISGSNE